MELTLRALLEDGVIENVIERLHPQKWTIDPTPKRDTKQEGGKLPTLFDRGSENLNKRSLEILRERNQTMKSYQVVKKVDSFFNFSLEYADDIESLEECWKPSKSVSI